MCLKHTTYTAKTKANQSNEPQNNINFALSPFYLTGLLCLVVCYTLNNGHLAFFLYIECAESHCLALIYFLK